MFDNRKWRSRLALSVGMVLVAVGVVSCSPTDSGGGDGADAEVVRIADAGEVVSLDPADDTSVNGDHRKYMFYEKLLDRAEDGTFEPVLATEWEQVDELTYEFTLRDNVIFHDGEAMTAEDVVYSFQRLIEGDYQDTINIAPYFSSAEVVDERTVRLHSVDPLGTFLPRASMVRIVPKHYVEKVGDEEFAKAPMGTGPFMFETFVRDTKITAVRFDDYWGEPAASAKIEWSVIPEASSRMASLMSGDIDIAMNLPQEISGQLATSDCCSVVEAPTNRAFFIGMNANAAPLDDPLVRQALNYAVDKETLASTLMGGLVSWHGEKGQSLLYGQSITGFDDSIQGYDYDPKKARDLLAKAGYPDGIDITFAGPRGRYPNDAALVEAMSAMLEEVGVRITLDINEWSTYWPKTQSGEQPGLWVLSLGNSLWDAEYYLTTYLSSTGRGYFHTPELDEQIFAASKNPNADERKKNLSEITRQTVEEQAPWIFLWDMVEVHSISEKVDGFSVGLNQKVDLASISVTK